MKDLGYSMNTGVLPVGRLPHALRRDNRYFGGQRLSLLVICLENQGNDSSNEHAELENSFPCNIHTCHPLSFTIGGKEASPPKKNRGGPPTGVLPAAPETAYHKIRQIARKTPVRVVRKYPTQQNAPAAQILRRRGLSFTFSPNRPASRCLNTR